MRAALLAMLFLNGLLALVAANQAKSLQSSPAEKVKVELFVMSKCPDGAYCENVFIPSLLRLAPILDLSVDYIAQRNSAISQANITCLHGVSECEGNRQQLCAQLLSSAAPLSLQYLNFTSCQAQSYRNVPDNAATCAKQSGFDADKLQSCVSSVGQQLLFDSVNYSRSRNQSTSCTVLIENSLWCIRDGGAWKQCNEGTDANSLITAVCKRYKGTDTPAVCQQALATTTTTDEPAVSSWRGLYNRLKL